MYSWPMGNLVWAILASLGIGFTTVAQKIQAPKFDPVMVPPEHIERFTFGYNEIIADLFWIRAIQSIDFCGSTFKTEEEVRMGDKTVKVCQEGWVFQLLDAATRITPRYRVIYSRGAISLSVIVNDRLGALKLFERGAKVYADDWVVRYHAGYHEGIKMNDPAGAAEEMKAAGALGAPNWLTLLAARLFNDAGQAEFGLQALADFYGTEPFEKWPERAQERWQELEEKLGRKVQPPQPPSGE